MPLRNCSLSHPSSNLQSIFGLDIFWTKHSIIWTPYLVTGVSARYYVYFTVACSRRIDIASLSRVENIINILHVSFSIDRVISSPNILCFL